jgi:hypothetical protein
MQLQVAKWHVECDRDATRRCYEPLPVGTDCSCDQCLNFNAAAGHTFPPEFMALAKSLGIDPTKPAELCHWTREPSGLYLTGGWFHFAGRILSGEDAIQYQGQSGNIKLVPLAPGVEVGCTHHAGLVPASFAGVAVCQLEFQTRVPWVLAGVEPAP